MASETVSKVAYLVNEEYGLGAASPELMRHYGHALLTIAGADGEVSEDEMTWLINHQRRLGVPDDIVESYRRFDYKSSDLFAILEAIEDTIDNWKTSAHLVYLAVRMAWADGEYADKERERVLRAAKIMMVPEDTVHLIHCLVELERTVNRMRVTLFRDEPADS